MSTFALVNVFNKRAYLAARLVLHVAGVLPRRMAERAEDVALHLWMRGIMAERPQTCGEYTRVYWQNWLARSRGIKSHSGELTSLT